jgi:hypothetical protein
METERKSSGGKLRDEMLLHSIPYACMGLGTCSKQKVDGRSRPEGHFMMVQSLGRKDRRARVMRCEILTNSLGMPVKVSIMALQSDGCMGNVISVRRMQSTRRINPSLVQGIASILFWVTKTV